MAKICPVKNGPVLYLDCLECDDKVCLSNNSIMPKTEKEGKNDERDHHEPFTG